MSKLNITFSQLCERTKELSPYHTENMRRDSSVGIATHYEMDGPGIESAPVQTGLGVQPVSCTMGTACFPGVKWSERDDDHRDPHL